MSRFPPDEASSRSTPRETTRTPSELVAEFRRHCQERDHLSAKSRDLEEELEDIERAIQEVNQQLALVHERIAQIAHELAAYPVSSLEALAAVSEVLLDYMSGDANDVIGRMTMTLCHGVVEQHRSGKR